MENGGKAWLVYNSASGQQRPGDTEAIVAALEAGGMDCVRRTDCHEGPAITRREVEQAGIGCLAIYGGDGTLNRTIGALEGWGGAVLALPGGTFNLLCRDLYGTAELDEVLPLVSERRLAPRRRSCIRTGGGSVALCEVLAGPGATWADVREELRDGHVAGVIEKSVEAASATVTGPPVVLAAPPRGREEGYAGLRLTPGSAGIRIQGYGADGPGEFVEQGIAILRRNFREGPHDDLGLSEEVRIGSGEGEPIPLMIDGERGEGAAEEHFALATLGIDLLEPLDGP